MGLLRQLRLLLWKNFTLRRREPFKTALEILMPLFLFIILALVRSRGLKDNMSECHFRAKPMPSAGILPFMQGFICNWNNTCYKNSQQSETPGRITAFNNSYLTKAVVEIEELMRNNKLASEVESALKELQNLQNIVRILNESRLRNLTNNITESSIGGFTISKLIQNTTEWRAALARQKVNFSDEAWATLMGASVHGRSLLSNWNNIFRIAPLLISNATELIRKYDLAKLLPSISGSSLKTMACNKSSILYSIVNYETTRETDMLEELLCNRSTADLMAIYRTARTRINTTAVQEEASRLIVNMTGVPMKSATKIYDRMRNLIASLGKQKGLMDLLKHVMDVTSKLYSDMSIVSPFEGVSSNSSIMKNIMVGMNFLCGASPDGNDVSRLLQQLEKDGKFNLGNLADSFRRRRRKRSVTGDDVTQRMFCATLSRTLNKRPFKYIWRQMRTILFGKILYTPNTPMTRKIVEAANSTFNDMAFLHIAAKRWIDIYSTQLFRFLMLDDRINVLRNVSSLCANRKIPILNSTVVGWCKRINDFLYKGLKRPGKTDWRDYLRQVDSAVNQLRLFTGCFDYNKFYPVKNESELVRLGMSGIRLGWFWAGIVFDNLPKNSSKSQPLPSHVKFRIRMDVDKVDSTRYFKVLDRYWRPGPRNRPWPDLKYFTYGFIYLQEMLERGITTLQTGKKVLEGAYMQQFPYPCYVKDKFTRAIADSLPMFMVLAWIFAVAITVRSIVYEKELRLKEYMRVMGLNNGVHWMAWFITTFVLLLCSVLLMLFILKVGNVLEFSDASVIFVFLLSFLMATLTQSFLISVFFSKANLAAACGGLIYFVLYLPYVLVQLHEEDIVEGALTSLSLLCQVALGIGCQYLARFEQQGTGVQWSNLWTNPAPDDNYNMGKIILMLWFDTFLYAILTWYIEAVFPGKFGVPRRWYFPIQRSYWCSDAKDTTGDVAERTVEAPDRESEDGFETEPRNLKLGVSVHNLRKVYKGSGKPAVDGLNLNFYEDQITSFLGHNGAGKTTTISILTGLYTPTSGSASIYGHDIRSDMDRIRHHIGLCPQYNVLFDNLTVEEHIWFYGLLKGLEPDCIDKEIERYIHEVGLPHKRHDISRSLSGGMKRKLSVAMAFVGGSKVIILDEPTAGVDPYARRSIWDILLRCRRDRTIILTTHHMDEADVLGDRIAIMAQGRLKCCGSAFFLKNRFANGYYLTLVKNVPEQREREMDEVEEKKKIAEANDVGSGSSSVDLEKLSTMVTQHVPEARLHEDVSTEVTYVMPYEAIERGEIDALLCDLELNGPAHGVNSFGLSDSTLEEVFLTVAGDPSELSPDPVRQDDGQVPRPIGRSSFRKRRNPLDRLKRRSSVASSHQDLLTAATDIDTVSVASSEGPSSSAASTIGRVGRGGAGSIRITGSRLVIRQFVALLIKRLLNCRRSKKGFIAEIIMPVVFIFLALLLTTLWPGFEAYPPMEIHPWLMAPKRGDSRLYMFYSNDRPEDKTVQEYERLLRTSVGAGSTRCMNPKVYRIDGRPCSPDSKGSWSQGPLGKIPNVTAECTCGRGLATCPAGAGGPSPSVRLMGSSDFLVNLTGYNITNYLQKTYRTYMKRRYGGISLGELNQDAKLKVQVPSSNLTTLFDIVERLTRSATANRTVLKADHAFWKRVQKVFDENLEVRNNLKVWFLNKGYVAPPAYLNMANNLILRVNLPKTVNKADYGISVWNHPMNFTRRQLDKEARKIAAIDTLMAICVIFALAFIPASFVLFLIDERVSNAKHLQFVSGVNPNIYWLANYVWDIINYIVPLIICIIIFVAFNKKAFVASENIGPFILLMLIYGLAIIPMMYPASFIFKTPSTAFVLLSCINLLVGMTSTLATFIIELLEDDEPDLADINVILKKVFLLLPQYCLGRGLIDLSRNQLEKEIASQYLDTYKATAPLSWDMLGKNVLCLAAECVFFFGLTLLIEHRFFYARWRCVVSKTTAAAAAAANTKDAAQEDDDVVRERERVLTGDASDDIMQVRNLTKVYRMNKASCPAVNHLTFGVKKGECFGLLGVNGAGKTTTFKMLTGDESVTDGDALINGYSVLREMVSVHQQVGYCPQFDALNENLTGRETLLFFARLRGVPEDEAPGVVDWVLRRMCLMPHADKTTHNYSGGNRRKLSTAIALIGDPPIMFLDEPTSGMDPGARRFLWNCIIQTVAEGRSVVLTSHSMEECEALCHRLAIMVNGEFKCLGANQHLKNKFGEGYTVTLRLASNNPRRDAVCEFMDDSFPGSVLKEEHYSVLEFQLPMAEVRLSEVFSKINAMKQLLGIDDYSVSQTTLDQVFINFAKEQSDMLRDERPVDNLANGDVGPSRDGPVSMPVNDDGQAYIQFTDLNNANGSSLRDSEVVLMSRGSLSSLPFTWSRSGSQNELIITDRNGAPANAPVKTHEARFNMSDIDV